MHDCDRQIACMLANKKKVRILADSSWPHSKKSTQSAGLQAAAFAELLSAGLLCPGRFCQLRGGKKNAIKKKVLQDCNAARCMFATYLTLRHAC